MGVASALFQGIRTHYRAGGIPRCLIALWHWALYRSRFAVLWYGFANLLVSLRCFASDTARVRVIGDSHSTVFQFAAPFMVYPIGPATAHHLITAESTTRSRERILRLVRRWKRGTLLLLVFGEIDCRIHLYHQHRKRKEPLTRLIAETVSRYGQMISLLARKGYVVMVYSVPPATRVGNQYRYPHYGSPEMRSRITAKFNRALEQFCATNRIPFIDVYTKTATAQGFMTPRYRADAVHFNRTVIPIVRALLDETPSRHSRARSPASPDMRKFK